MPEYSSKQTAGDIVVSAQLDTTANTITYTVTGPNGLTTTATQQAPVASTAFSPVTASTATLRTLLGPFQAAGTDVFAVANSITDVTRDVTTQATRAEAAATVTKTPVPENPAPPPSTNNQADPAVAPAPNNTPIVENSSPPAAVPTSSDPAQQQQANQNIVETIKYDGGVTTVSPFNDPAQRAQAQQDAIAAETPATPSQFEDPATRGAAVREAIENPGPVSPSNIVDPAQRQQNEIIQSEFPAKISNVQDPAQRAQAQQAEIEFADSGPQTAANPMGLDPAQRQGLSGPKLDAQSQPTQQDAANTAAADDWRVRLSLAPGATYLYKNKGKEGILLPLAATNGIIFPYTPSIQVQYVANYDPTEITHSNYKFFSYRGSAVDSITIGCEFTAQDTKEAEYLLAVIHFLRSVTKMFYGQDQNPKNGTPPPLCYLSGLGTYQFDNHPLAITGFTYQLPTDVDYIRAQSVSPPPGVSTAPSSVPSSNSNSISSNRLAAAGASPGALANPPVFDSSKAQNNKPTYVPTKISITITAVPIVTRNDISNNFSLQEYGTGALLRGKQRKSGGGIW